ncbi:unnamed protein product [Symbiodinium sp. CCMP2592]|nr:unnamed protein product [Symbiodinium sp. CCMP2592]
MSVGRDLANKLTLQNRSIRNSHPSFLREASARASLLSRPARGLEWKSYGSALRLLRATPANAAPFLVNHSRDCLEQSTLGSRPRERLATAMEGESSDEATPTEAESDGRESFLLVTSGEFCEGTARSRATWREPERSRADLEAWEREEEAEHRKAGRAYHPISSAEVLQLLGEVPPGLSGRYSSRLRAEAQRRRSASAVSQGSGGLMRRSLLLVVVFLLLQDTASRQRSLAASLAAAELSSALPFRHREIETAADPFLAAEPADSTAAAAAAAAAPVVGAAARRAAAGCDTDAMGRAEDEAISLEVLSRRDILGYHQMLLAIHDWTSTLRRGPGGHPAVSGALPAGGTVAECLAAESSRYLDLVKRLRRVFLASHRRAATARSRWTLERQTRLTPPPLPASGSLSQVQEQF